VGGQDEHPPDVDLVGVGEGVAVGLWLVPVEDVDFPPPERVAELGLGDVPQVVALDHAVDAAGRVLRPSGNVRGAVSTVGGDAGDGGEDARPGGCGEGGSRPVGRRQLDRRRLGGCDRDGRGVGGGVRGGCCARRSAGDRAAQRVQQDGSRDGADQHGGDEADRTDRAPPGWAGPASAGVGGLADGKDRLDQHVPQEQQPQCPREDGE